MMLFIWIKRKRQFFGNQSLSVKLQYFNIRRCLHTGIFPHGVCSAVICNGDDMRVLHNAFRVVDHNDPFFGKQIRDIPPLAAGQHQSVVCVQFGKLTIADLHPQHDPLPQGFVHIFPHKAKRAVSAHACRTLKGKITIQAFPEINEDPFGTEHTLCFLLLFQNLAGCPSIENACEVDVNKNLRKQIAYGFITADVQEL